jgi:L-galactose dehydrogenase
MMIGFNFLNPSASEHLFPTMQAKGIGVLGMFAVRRALSHPEVLREVLKELIAHDFVKGDSINLDTLTPILPAGTSEEDLTDIAYRFCRDTPGVDVVLSGTGNPAHLEANIRSLTAPPLEENHRTALLHLFAKVNHLSGN